MVVEHVPLDRWERFSQWQIDLEGLAVHCQLLSGLSCSVQQRAPCISLPTRFSFQSCSAPLSAEDEDKQNTAERYENQPWYRSQRDTNLMAAFERRHEEVVVEAWVWSCVGEMCTTVLSSSCDPDNGDVDGAGDSQCLCGFGRYEVGWDIEDLSPLACTRCGVAGAYRRPGILHISSICALTCLEPHAAQAKGRSERWAWFAHGL